MALIGDLLYSQKFISTDRIVINHSLNRENIGIQLIVGGFARADLIKSTVPVIGNEKGAFVVNLISPQTGTVQVFEFQLMLIGTPSVTKVGKISTSDSLIECFMKHLLHEGVYTKREISDGMITSIFSDVSELPEPPESGVENPAFAVIDDGYIAKLAYWNFYTQSEWVVTEFGWENPINPPEWIIKQNNSIGSGNSSWAYSMGTEFRILAPADGGAISNFSIKFCNTSNHAWSVRKSTYVGTNAPSLSSYTNVVASGTYANTTDNVWETISGFSPITVAENEWYVALVYVGQGGQSFSLDSSKLNETLATVYAGVYSFIGGSSPGSTSIPTTRSTSTIYGLCAVEITP